jgi:hypothetical protein
MVGIEMREQAQVELLRSYEAAYRAEYDALPQTMAPGSPAQFYLDNPFFGSVDAEMLYCMVRHHKPRRIIEIGSGFSTMLSALALLRNAADGAALGELDAYDPHPSDVLRRGFPGLHSLNVTRAEDIPLADFRSLGRDDILFIDSSHIVKIGGDVVYEFLEVLPRISNGVVVHVHDIFLPRDYPKDWVLEHRLFWSEQYLLHAFLAFNQAFAVLWGASFMHARHSGELRAAFSSYDPASTRPGSFWMQRIK